MSDEGPGAPIENTLAEAAFVGCLLLSPAGEAVRLLDLVDDSDFANDAA